MTEITFHDVIKKKSGFANWGGRLKSNTARFHHLIFLPKGPPGLGGYSVLSISRPPGAEPVLDWSIWNLGEKTDRPGQFVVHVLEYPTIQDAHEGLIDRLASITRAGVDFVPVPNGAGDVQILNYMVRDNLLVQATAVDPGIEAKAAGVLKDIDTWLNSDWPRQASIAGGADLYISLSPAGFVAHINEGLEITIHVTGQEGTIDLNKLSHRFFVEPGRIVRRDGNYLFYGLMEGPATILLEVVSPDGSYGEASITVEVHR